MADAVVEASTETKIPDAPVAKAAEAKVETIGSETDKKVVEGSEAKEDVVQDPEEVEKKQSRLDKRFSILTTQKKSALAEVQLWKETVADAVGEAPPDRKSFGSDADYQAAVNDYRENIRTYKANLKVAEKSADKVEAAMDTALIETWDDKIAEYGDTLPNFAKVVGAAKIPISGPVQKAILKSKVGPAIVYHLATNPDAAYELNEMSVEEQLLEIGRLGSQVQPGRKAVPDTKKETKSPNPPPNTKVKGEAPVSAKAPKDMNFDEYRAWRRSGGGN